MLAISQAKYDRQDYLSPKTFTESGKKDGVVQ